MGCLSSLGTDFRIYDDLMTTTSANSCSEAALTPRLFVLIPCAGTGTRAGTQRAKQYEPIDGLPLVCHTVAAFRAMPGAFAALCVVLSPGDEDFEAVFPDYGGAGEILLKNGGNTRAATVLNGLKALVTRPHGGAALHDWVLVHDAARCLITPELVQRLIDECRDDAVGGLLVQKLPDTLKSGVDGRVAATIDRSDKWLAQTPQMFRVGSLMQALEKAESSNTAITDESSAMEAMGLSPRLVSSSAQNFKITYPEDFALAEAILQSRKKQLTSSVINESIAP